MFRVIQESYFNTLIHTDQRTTNISRGAVTWNLTPDLNKLIFSFLGPCNLVNAGRVCKSWKVITTEILNAFDVRKISSCLWVFDASDWKQCFPNLEIKTWREQQIVNLEEPVHDPQMELPFLEAFISHLNENNAIEENLGITVLTVPRSLTMETLAKHVNSLDDQKPKLIDATGIPGKMTNVCASNTYRLIITNHYLKGTGFPSCEEQIRISASGHKLPHSKANERSTILKKFGFRSVDPTEAVFHLTTTFFASGLRLYASESSSYTYLNEEYYGDDVFVGKFSETGFICGVGSESRNPGRYGEAGAVALHEILSVPFKDISFNIEHRRFKIDGQTVSLTPLPPEDDLDVFTPSALRHIIPGVENNRLVVKTFNGKGYGGELEKTEARRKNMESDLGNYHEIQKLLPIATLYNSATATQQCFYIQEYVTGTIDTLNTHHIEQARTFYLTALQKRDITLHLLPEYLRVAEDGTIKLTRFAKKGYLSFAIYDGLKGLCKLYRAQSGADQNETLDFLTRFTMGFDQYGYRQEHEDMMKSIFKTDK